MYDDGFLTMSIASLSPRQLLPLVLLAAMGLLAWLAAPVPPPLKAGATAAEAWEMPKARPRELARWVAAIDQHRLWGGGTAPASSSDVGGVDGGGGAGAASGAGEKISWSLVGVVIQGDQAFTLVSVGDQPSRQYGAGDGLPDGSKILKIEEDRLHLLVNGKESILEIYRK